MTKKTIKRAAADLGLIFIAYNLRRIFNLIDPNELKQYLKVLTLLFWTIKVLFKAFCNFVSIITTQSFFLKRS
jgi:hypothetical protein